MCQKLAPIMKFRAGGWKSGVSLLPHLGWRGSGAPRIRYEWSGRVYSRRMLLPRREMSAP
jgi:hypothetical protein